MSARPLPFWFSPCPLCGGQAVWRVIAGQLVGACAALEIPCYWSAAGAEAEAAMTGAGAAG